MAVMMSSGDFNQDTAAATQAATQGPVFITDGGRPSHVLLSLMEYRRLVGEEPSIADLLAFPGAEDIDLPLSKDSGPAPVADLS